MHIIGWKLPREKLSGAFSSGAIHFSAEKRTMRTARMLMVGCVAVLAAACASAPAPTPVLVDKDTLSVITATGIILPEVIVDVTRNFVKADPANAALIAATAVSAAPQQAVAIRAAVIQSAPDQAEAVINATNLALSRVPTRIDAQIRSTDDVSALADEATR